MPANAKSVSIVVPMKNFLLDNLTSKIEPRKVPVIFAIKYIIMIFIADSLDIPNFFAMYSGMLTFIPTSIPTTRKIPRTINTTILFENNSLNDVLNVGLTSFCECSSIPVKYNHINETADKIAYTRKTYFQLCVLRKNAVAINGPSNEAIALINCDRLRKLVYFSLGDTKSIRGFNDT